MFLKKKAIVKLHNLLELGLHLGDSQTHLAKDFWDDTLGVQKNILIFDIAKIIKRFILVDQLLTQLLQASSSLLILSPSNLHKSLFTKYFNFMAKDVYASAWIGGLMTNPLNTFKY